MRINNKYVWENDLSLNDLVLKQKERIEYLERSNNRREDEILELRQENADLDNIINELEKILNYDIDKSEEYMNKIRRSSLQQGDYPVHYYRAEWQKEKAIGYLDKIYKLKGDGSNE